MHGPGQSRTEYQPCAFAGLDMGFETLGSLRISGDGTQSRDFVHVDDVARAFELALLADYRGKALDICTGVQTSMNEVAELLKVPVIYTERRPGDAQMLISDPEPAFEAICFKSALNLKETLLESFPSVQARNSHQLVQA